MVMNPKQKKIVLVATAISIFAGISAFTFFKIKNNIEAKKNKTKNNEQGE